LPGDTHVGLPFVSAHMIGVLKKRGQVDERWRGHRRHPRPRDCAAEAGYAGSESCQSASA